MVAPRTDKQKDSQNAYMEKLQNIKVRVPKEVSTNNCCKFIAIFIVFPGFCLKQLQQLFSDNS